jgi:hypothetical protein
MIIIQNLITELILEKSFKKKYLIDIINNGNLINPNALPKDSALDSEK